MTVDALRDTLAAQGIDEDHETTETLGRQGVRSVRLTLPGARIGPEGTDSDFVVRDELGRGGMGVVELAQQRALRRDVAVKRLLESTPEKVEALLHEATLTGQLEHPNIVPVHAVVTDDEGRPAVVMKRISGIEWLDLIEAGDTSLEDHLRTFLQVCNAVSFAHSRGVVHRDIKPANVMIGEYGEVYLVDWGVARAKDDSPSERIAGTPAYIAPEMIDGHFDERSDVFLLGATLHEVITGDSRHPGTKLLRVLRHAQRCKPHDFGPDVARELGDIVNRACAKAPEDRFASVAALQEAVRIYIRHRAIDALVEAGRERLRELETELASESPDYTRAQSFFSAARFGFEQALQGWPESPDAWEGRESCLRVMAEHELDLRHPAVAEALLDAMEDPPGELSERLSSVRTEIDQERARIRELEQDRDQGFGAGERTRATIGFAVAVVLLTGGFVTLRVLYPSYAPPALRFAIVGVAVFLTAAGIVRWWSRRSQFNLINRRIAQVILVCLGASMLNRFSALAAQAGAAEILRTDAIILGVGGLALTPFHRSGPWLASLSFGVAFVGAFQPAWLELMFIGLAVLIPIVFMLVRRRSSSTDG